MAWATLLSILPTTRRVISASVLMAFGPSTSLARVSFPGDCPVIPGHLVQQQPLSIASGLPSMDFIECSASPSTSKPSLCPAPATSSFLSRNIVGTLLLVIPTTSMLCRGPFQKSSDADRVPYIAILLRQERVVSRRRGGFTYIGSRVRVWKEPRKLFASATVRQDWTAQQAECRQEQRRREDRIHTGFLELLDHQPRSDVNVRGTPLVDHIPAAGDRSSSDLLLAPFVLALTRHFEHVVLCDLPSAPGLRRVAVL